MKFERTLGILRNQVWEIHLSFEVCGNVLQEEVDWAVVLVVKLHRAVWPLLPTLTVCVYGSEKDSLSYSYLTHNKGVWRVGENTSLEVIEEVIYLNYLFKIVL